MTDSTTNLTSDGLRKTGLSLVGDIPWGTHFCHFYETKEDLFDILIPYFKTGLEGKEFCLWVVCDPLNVEEAKEALRLSVPGAERYLTNGDIEIMPHSQMYLKDGALALARAGRIWQEKLTQALDKGYTGLRVNGSSAWLTENDWRDFLEYESKLHVAMAEQRMIVLCTYPLAVSRAVEIFDVAHHHDFVIARRRGTWEVLKTPELKQAKAEIKRLNAELEERVERRTRELTTANDGLRTEIAARQRAEACLEGQKRVLEMMAGEVPLSESLCALLRLIEAQVPGMLGSILLLDDLGNHLHHGAAPSLPLEYMVAIDGVAIGPCVGSCGSAAYCKEPIFAEDIATDPRWKDHRSLALPHGLRACWSTPIFDAQRKVLGTFAMYYRHPALPEPEHLRLIEMATHIAAIAITRQRAQAVLRESEAKLKEAQRLAHIGYWERDLLADRITWSEETYRIWGQNSGEKINQAKLQEMIHPDDRQLQSQALTELRQKGTYDLEYRIIRPDGQISFIHVWDEVVRDPSGRVIRAFGTVQDITERKQAEAFSRAQAQEINAIVDNSPDCIARYDRELRPTYVNPAAIKTLGLSEKALLGNTAGSSARKGAAPATMEEVEILQRSLDSVFNTGQPLDFETTWLAPSGRRYYTVHLEPEFDAHGACKSVVSIARDITGRRQSEDALRQSESQLRLVIDTIPVMAWIVLSDGTVDFLNQRCLDFTGLSLEEYIKMPIRLLHPEDLPRVMEKWLSRMADGQPYEDEMRLRASDGTYRWFLVRTAPLRDDQGKVLKWFGTSTDIEDRKQAEGELRESQRLLHLVLATLPVGVAVLNQAGDIILNNDASKRIWGGPRIISGRERWARSKGFWHESGEAIAPENWASVRALSQGQTSLDELIDIETYDGQHKTIKNSAAPIRNAEGLIVGAIIVNEDVTEPKKNEEKLLQSREKLRALTARVELLRENERIRISREIHDNLGAKLTGLRMDLQWAERKLNDLGGLPEVNPLLDRIVAATELVDEIISTVQEVAGELRPGVLDKLGLGAALQFEARRFLKRTGLPCQIHLPETEPVLPAEHSTALFRIFQECLTNVARHARATRVDAELKIEDRSLVLRVQDNGQGIAGADLANRESLGLLGMRERAESLGGEIHFQRGPNGGALVVVRIPLGEAPPHPGDLV